MDKIEFGQRGGGRAAARLRKDRWAGLGMRMLTLFSGMLAFLMVFGLYVRSRPILAVKPLGRLLFSSNWHPLKGEFGFFTFIMGTLWVSLIAVALAVPLSLLTSAYLSEYAHKRVRLWSKPLIDVLAGIPSVVYGLWGILIVVPFVRDHVAPLFLRGEDSGLNSTGYCVLSGGIVLAVMICPIIVHVSSEVFSYVPREMREVSLALGATRWQTVKLVVFRKAFPGVIAAVVLGLSRALGETMAVLMVVGNMARVPRSVLDPGYPLPALIANNYGEMMSIPLYDSALMLASLVLLLVILMFNVIAWLVLARVRKRTQ